MAEMLSLARCLKKTDLKQTENTEWENFPIFEGRLKIIFLQIEGKIEWHLLLDARDRVRRKRNCGREI